MKKHIYTSFFLFLLVGCGGGTSQIISQDITNSTASKVKNSASDPEAMKRILGEDKDNDGIRDDMAVWIENNFKSSSERKVLRIFALDFQKVMQLKTREDAQREFGVVFSPTVSCAYGLAFKEYPNEPENRRKLIISYLEKTKELKKIGSNTLERYWRYDEGESNLHGLISSYDVKEAQKNSDIYCKEK